jgi:hypothetical protein
VNLAIGDIAELPAAAALFDSDDALITATPEWRGLAPGTIRYRARATSLAVATASADAESMEVVDRLLHELDATAGDLDGDQSKRIVMLAVSLRLVMGRSLETAGTSHDVIDLAVAGIRARTHLQVSVAGQPPFAVRSPEAAALCLLQLAVNAERHTRTTRLTLAQEGRAFHVTWPGRSGRADAFSARRHHDRRGWGLGFSRIAADAIGAVLHPPRDAGDGTVSATLELGMHDLAFPVAQIRDRTIRKATRTWDEETGCLPGSEVQEGTRLAGCLDSAAARPRHIVRRDGWSARRVGDRTWIAVLPDDVIDRARDVVTGLGHERALWEGIGEPRQSAVFALGALLGGRLGSPLPRSPAGAWNRRMADLASAFRLPGEVPQVRGLGAVDPRIAAYLAAELGAGFVEEGDELLLRVRGERLGDPRLSCLPRAGGAVRLT